MTRTPTEAGGERVHDIAVIGAGIVGSAIARELSGFDLDVALLESRQDVGDGTSKANTALLHTGFDATPGTLESRMVSRGYDLLADYASRTGIPVEPTGATLVAWDEEQLAVLPGLQEKACANGYDRTFIIDAEEVYAQLPHLGEGALGGLVVPGESIICTWTTNLALATEAVLRGTHLALGHEVRGIDLGAEITIIETSAGPVRTRWVVNAAGLDGDHIDRLFGHDRFTITPRRGELIVYDKQARPLVDRIVLPVPTSKGKGVLVSPTIYGNVMLGPTAEDIEDKSSTGTTEIGFEFLRDKGRRLMPVLLDEEITATYAGLRAASSHPDYLVEVDASGRYVIAGGIRSTGLTSGMAVAEHIVGLLHETDGIELRERTELPEAPLMPNIGEAYIRPYQDAARIAADAAYGKIVCFCERVTAGEIRDTFSSPIPPRTLEGLSRRTRAHNGRCQGFYCGAEVRELLETRAASLGSEIHQHSTEGAR